MAEFVTQFIEEIFYTILTFSVIGFGSWLIRTGAENEQKQQQEDRIREERNEQDRKENEEIQRFIFEQDEEITNQQFLDSIDEQGRMWGEGNRKD